MLPYLISKLGDLELEIADVESSAGTADDDDTLHRLTAARNSLAGAADDAILRRLPELSYVLPETYGARA